MNNICCRLFLNSLVHKTTTSTYSLLSPSCCVAIEPFNLFPFLCGPTIFVKGLQGQRTSLKLEAPPFHHHHQHHSSKETPLLMFQLKSAYTPCKCYTLLIFILFFSYILLLCSWKRRLFSSQLPIQKMTKNTCSSSFSWCCIAIGVQRGTNCAIEVLGYQFK